MVKMCMKITRKFKKNGLMMNLCIGLRLEIEWCTIFRDMRLLLKSIIYMMRIFMILINIHCLAKLSIFPMSFLIIISRGIYPRLWWNCSWEVSLESFLCFGVMKIKVWIIWYLRKFLINDKNFGIEWRKIVCGC